MPHQVFFDLLAARDFDSVAARLRHFSLDEWRYFVTLAVQQKCAPWVRDALNRGELRGCTPPEAQQALAKAIRHGAARNLHAFRLLHDIALRVDPKTPLIVLKGARLARTHYPNTAMRPMQDTDLMVRPAHLAQVSSTLLALGYVQSISRRAIYSDVEYHEIAFSKASTTVELHWSLLDEGHDFTIDYEALWSRAMPGDEGCLWYLSLEDQLLHVCLHAAYAHELQIGLYPFRDIALLCADPQLNWSTFIRRAREWRAERCAYLTLKVAAHMAAARLPPEIDALRPPDYGDEVLQRAMHSVTFSLDLESLPRERFGISEFIARLCSLRGWRTLPRTLVGRFLLPAPRRSRWSDDASTSWVGQVAPLLRGLPAVLIDPTIRRRVRARVLGKRTSGWIRRPFLAS